MICFFDHLPGAGRTLAAASEKSSSCCAARSSVWRKSSRNAASIRPSIAGRPRGTVRCLMRMEKLMVCFFSLLVVLAQAQPQPPRDRVPTPPPGTAVIKGRVVDGQSGNALARARVRLQGPGNRPPVITDETGAFKITDIPAGSVYLLVERNGYMSMPYPEPKKTIRTSMGQLLIKEGQVLEGVTIAMSRGGAITGRVLDPYGEPADGAQVQLFRVTGSGRGRPQQRMGVGVNDLGEFRLARIEPGSYLLRAQSRSSMSWNDDGAEMQ